MVKHQVVLSPEVPVIPDHELLRLIGRGSYGEVWMARNAFGTLRAVKVVRRSTFESDKPFTRELSGIQRYEPISRAHDGLVDILQVGRNDQAQFFYYVMELADDAETGQPVLPDDASIAAYRPRMLSSTVTNGEPLSPQQSIPLFLILAEGIGHLHAGGLLHRDIKSSNVIFVNGVPKLADLGLVAEAGESRTFVGTEGFIPPEGPGTKTADIYAFGKLMYEAATGRDRMEFPTLPLNRENPEENHYLLELNAVLLRCCAPDPTERYPSIAQLLANLAILRSGQSVQELRSFQRRLRLARHMGAVAVFIAVILLGINFVVQHQAGIARANFNRAEALRLRSEAAEKAAQDHLFRSLVAQGAAERHSGRAGARGKALAALTEAARLRPATPELRSEFISSLALPDVYITRRFYGATNAINSMVMSPDGSIAAQPVAGGDVKLIRMSDGSNLRILPGAGNLAGIFSPDGRFLMTEFAPGIQKIWDVELGREIIVSSNVEFRLFDFGPNSNQITLRKGNKLIVRTVEEETVLPVKNPEQIDRIRISGTNGFLAWTDQTETTVHVVHLPDGIEQRQLRMEPDIRAMSFAWSPDQDTLAVGTSSHRILLWHPATTNRPIELIGHGAEVVSLNWSHNSKLLISGCWDSTTRIWNVEEGREIARHLVTAWQGAFLPGDKQLALYSAVNNEVIFCDVQMDEVGRRLREPGGAAEKSPYNCLFSPDSSILFEGCHDGMRAYRTSDGELVGYLPGSRFERIHDIPNSPDELVVVTDRQRGIVRWRKDESGKVSFSPFESMERVDLAKHDVLGRPWVGGNGPGLNLYYSNGVVRALPHSEGAIISTTSRDGHWVVASLPLRAGYWNISGKDPTYSFRDLGPARSYGIACSHDSQKIYHVTLRDLCCTDAATGRLIWRTRLTENSNVNAGIAESGDGRIVAVGLPPFTISLIDASSGAWLTNIEHPDDQPINGMAFSPDDRWFAVAYNSHITQLWDLKLVRLRLAEIKADW